MYRFLKKKLFKLYNVESLRVCLFWLKKIYKFFKYGNEKVN